MVHKRNFYCGEKVKLGAVLQLIWISLTFNTCKDIVTNCGLLIRSFRTFNFFIIYFFSLIPCRPEETDMFFFKQEETSICGGLQAVCLKNLSYQKSFLKLFGEFLPKFGILKIQTFFFFTYLKNFFLHEKTFMLKKSLQLW